MDRLARDLRYAWRVLRKRPATTAVAVLCLALGIGGATTIFSLVHGVLLRPLDYPDPDRVVLIWNDFRQPGLSKVQVSGHEYVDLQEGGESLAEVAGIVPWFFNLTHLEDPLRVIGARASANLFPLLGIDAAQGRLFNEAEAAGRAPVAVLSHELWQVYLGAEPGIVGSTISLADVPYEVIGVLPADVYLPFDRAGIWVPWSPGLRFGRAQRGVMAIGRLRPGVTLEQGQADMDRLAARFRDEHPDVYPDASAWRLRLGPVREEIVGDSGPRLWLLFGAVGLVLLIACVNVANLLLAQAATREKEAALRASLGAGRGTLVRQYLTEGLVLAILGGALGALLAVWGVRAAASFELGRLGDIPRIERVAVDGWALAFAAAVTLATALVFGLAPALRAARLDLVASLGQSGRSSGADLGRRPLQKVLIVAEIALALLVLVGAGLMLRSFERLQRVDPGFRTEGTLTGQLFLPRTQYGPPQAKHAFYRRLLESFEGHAGIRTAGIVSHLPLYGMDLRGTVQAEGREPVAGAPNPTVGLRSVSPDYFRAAGIPLLEGRDFDDRDDENADPVVVVDAALARRLWPEGSAIGRRLQVDTWDARPRTVVGVVGRVHHLDLASDPQEQLYAPFLQQPFPVVGLVLDAPGDPLRAVPALREAVKAVDPLLPVDVKSVDRLIDDRLKQPRFNFLLFGLFGGVALVLAAVGVYGVMATSVSQRVGEIGVRMAFGARRADVLKMILAQGAALAVLGLVAGGVLTAVLATAARGWLTDTFYGGRTADALTLILVALLLVAVATLASLVPARRATCIDPMAALREE